MACVARRPIAKPALILAIGWLCSIPVIACAMDFKSITVPQGGIAITADGPIVSGDDARLINLLNSIPKSQLKQIRGIALNSDGGSPFVAEALGNIIHRMNVSVGVMDGDRCASACFILFASGRTKFVQRAPLIGVHSPRINGYDDSNAKAAGMRIELGVATIKELTFYSVPQAIIDKLISTNPDSMTWLTIDDLKSMGVQFRS